MKKRIEKAKENASTKTQKQREVCDDAYRQINSSAFKYNFKLLLGHYKLQGEEPRVS